MCKFCAHLCQRVTENPFLWSGLNTIDQYLLFNSLKEQKGQYHTTLADDSAVYFSLNLLCITNQNSKIEKKKPNNLTGQVDAMLREYGETGVYNHIKRESMARLEYTITLSTSYRIKLTLFSLQAHRLDHLHQKKKKNSRK